MREEYALCGDGKEMMAQGLIREDVIDADVNLVAEFLHKAFSIKSAKNPA
jgi:hypothetical protein